MHSLRELMRSYGKSSSFNKWADARKIPKPDSKQPRSLHNIMGYYARPKLWGFADLHAHPASHLAMGADASGKGGILWGSPGLAYESSSIDEDLRPCDAHIHSGFDADLVRFKHREGIFEPLSRYTPHGTCGCPSFDAWPHASSLTHQQMHISSIRRAWEGGLRLMIASVTDNELISLLWNRGANVHLNPFDNPSWPGPNPSFGFDSAVRQLNFIHDLVNANSSWIEIVTTSNEARQAVNNNKLAVILGVEMDALTAEQILDLKDSLKVSQVVPIHLANSSFGGVAVYDDLFNTNNWYLQGGSCFDGNDNHHIENFFCVETDPNLGFKIGSPQYLLMTKWNGSIEPQPVSDSDYAGLCVQGYSGVGHKNQQGLNSSELMKLMKGGLMIDLAHMSEKSMQEALTLSAQYSYPMMNTHTGMRLDNSSTYGNIDASERDISTSQMARLTEFGGVIGIGTSGYRDKDGKPNGDQLEQWINTYFDMFNAMNGRGVSIGTDTNGLSPLIPCSSKSIKYPFKVFVSSSRDAYNYLPASTMGTKTFDFSADGLAHYGMLADFIAALREYDDKGADIADYFLFRTAEETIKMWEDVELSAGKLQ